MNDQEKNDKEVTPEASVEETAPQAADAGQASGVPAPETQAPTEEIQAPAGETQTSGAVEEAPGEGEDGTGEASEEKTGEPVGEEAGEKPADSASGEINTGIKATPGKIALAVGFVVVLMAALIALVISCLGGKAADPTGETETTQASETQQTDPSDGTEETVAYTIPADGDPADVTCKGSYTASDEDVIAARDAVVATAGDYSLTVGQLQVYYWMQVREFLSQYGYYLSYFGLDYAHGLDTQLCPAVEGQTWQQYFLNQALACWQSYQSMAAEAEKHGVEMPEAYRDQMKVLADDLTQTAESSGFDSVDALVTAMLGGAATYDDYDAFLNLYYEGLSYYAQVTEGYSVTDEEIENYFDENAAAYEENGLTKDSTLVNVRHILIMPEGATSETIRTEEFSEDAWAAGEKRANELLEAWKEGGMTEESFAALAKEHSEDEGSKENGGLYEDMSQGQMVAEFNDWCFDPDRQPGDFDIVKTDFGYHIMYFCQSRPQWPDYAREDLLAQMANTFAEETAELYPLTVSYDKILLAFVDLTA